MPCDGALVTGYLPCEGALEGGPWEGYAGGRPRADVTTEETTELASSDIILADNGAGLVFLLLFLEPLRLRNFLRIPFVMLPLRPLGVVSGFSDTEWNSDGTSE